MWSLTILCWPCTMLATLSHLDIGKEGKEDQYPLDHFPLTHYILMCAALVCDNLHGLISLFTHIFYS